jgi:hypothetical protein
MFGDLRSSVVIWNLSKFCRMFNSPEQKPKQVVPCYEYQNTDE